MDLQAEAEAPDANEAVAAVATVSAVAPASYPPLFAAIAEAAAIPDALPAPAAPPAAPPAPIRLPLAPRAPTEAGATSASTPPGTPSAAATVGGLALIWLAFEKLGLARALVALYFRVQPGELLENERRERVVALIRERPGIGPTDIAEDLGTGWGVTSYHLDRLERAGLVASQRVGHHRCYFLPGAIPRDQQRTVALFRGETTRRVAELVAKCPGIAQSQLCQQLGLSPSAASKQVSRLEATGLIRRATEAGSLRLFPTSDLTVVS